MKIYLRTAAILFAMVLVNCDQLMEKEKQETLDCAKETGFDVKAPINSHGYDPKKTKCYHACIMKKSGTMANGKIISEKIIEILEIYNQKSVGDSVKEAFTECISKANELNDECMVVGAYQYCLAEKGELIKPE